MSDEIWCDDAWYKSLTEVLIFIVVANLLAVPWCVAAGIVAFTPWMAGFVFVLSLAGAIMAGNRSIERKKRQ